MQGLSLSKLTKYMQQVAMEVIHTFITKLLLEARHCFGYLRYTTEQNSKTLDLYGRDINIVSKSITRRKNKNCQEGVLMAWSACVWYCGWKEPGRASLSGH